MTTKAKRILCLLLSMVMLLSLLPMAALADGGGESWTDLNSYVTGHGTTDREIKLEAGKYYLSSNLSIEGHYLQVGDESNKTIDVTIDLSGHVLSTSQLKENESMAIKVTETSTLTVLDSAPGTTNTVSYNSSSKTFTGGVILANRKCFSTSNNATITLKGGTIFSYSSSPPFSSNCVSLNNYSALYADGGVIDGRVSGDANAKITRHSDATDYTTFNGVVDCTIEDAAKLTVNFVDSGTTVATQKVLKGQKLTAPTAPTDKEDLDLSFDGWVKADGTKWNFGTDPVTESMTLTAKWQHGASWTVLTKAIATQSTGLSAGKYYLSGDLDLGQYIIITGDVSGNDVTIDLNGHVLKSSLDLAIQIGGNGHLTLLDSGTGGKVKGASSDSNLDAAVIKLVSAKESGVEYPSYLTLKGGTICGSVALDCMNGSPCVLYADGGTVKGNLFASFYAHITRHDATDYTIFERNVSINRDATVNDNAMLTVNFVDGDTTVATQTVFRGQKLDKPTPDGKLILSCTKADGTTPWDFNDPVLEHTNGVVNLNAKWLGVEGSHEGFTAKLGEASAAGLTPLERTATRNSFSTEFLSKFSLKYVDSDGNAPTEPTTLTISGVTVTDASKPVYVIVQKDNTSEIYRAELGRDVKLSFTMSGKDSHKYLDGCDVAITQSNLSGDMEVKLPLPQKLSKNEHTNKYIATYSVEATSLIDIGDSYSYDTLRLRANGVLQSGRVSFPSGESAANFLNANEAATLTAEFDRNTLISGALSTYAELTLAHKGDLTLHATLHSPTLTSSVCLVEFAESSAADAEITDAYLVETGESLGTSMPTDPKMDGYGFDGWFYKDSSDAEVPFSGDTAVTTSITVYPKFARDTFAVSFDPKNDGVITTVNAPTNEALGDNMPADPTKAGYRFVGWFYKDSDGTEREFTDETIITGKMDVYAKWSVIVNYYTLTYVSNGGTEYAPERYVYGTVVELDKVPVREGYAFTGWFADETLTEKIDSIRMNYFKTVYAGWEKEKAEFTLTYVSSGGTEYAPETYAEGTVVALDKVPTREGYVFTGWYADETLKQAVTSVEMTSNKTVYAGWKGEYVPPELNSGDHIAYVKGYVDGTVKPMNNLTRAETAMMLYRLLTDEHRAEIAAVTNNYTDVSAKDWYNEAVSTMTKGGYITGYVDGTFGGENNITRSEFIAILVRFIGVIDGAQCSYSDVPADHWAYDYIATATTAGWIVGSGDGKFNPDALITRAEAMTIINRVLDRGVDEDSTLPEFKLWPDNTPDDWFYFDVIEATSSHEYTGSRPSENWLSVEK